MRPAEELLSALIEHPRGWPTLENTTDARRLHDAAHELRRRGYDVIQEGECWRLKAGNLLFSPQRFESLHAGSLGRQFEVWFRTRSTNDLAAEAASDLTSESALFVAEEQTVGRGRQGRRWECGPEMGLMFSVLLKQPEPDTPQLQLLPLAMAVAVCEAIRDRTSLRPMVKWPNDILLGQRKLAGILLEARSLPRPHIVIGIGLNWRGSSEYFAARGLENAAALNATVSQLSREELLSTILEHIDRRYRQWRAAHHAQLIEDWGRYDSLAGKRVRLQLGDQPVTGVACGITPDGFLNVRDRSGSIRSYAAGEVHLI